MLTIRKFQTKKEAKAVVNKAHLFIADGSGSMYQAVDQLKHDIGVWIDRLQDGDVVTVGWFSSLGQYDYFIRNATINSTNRARLRQLILDNIKARNMTCFSEVLNVANETIIGELAATNLPIFMTFFTDGYPTVGNLRQEETRTLATLKAIAPALTDAMFIGYRYHNVSLMAAMAKAAGGQLIHANNIHEVGEASERFLDNDTGRVTTPYPAEPVLAFQIEADHVEYVAWFDGALHSKPGDVYVVEKAATFESCGVLASYATAALLAELGQADLALQVLGEIGDIHLIDMLNNAILPQEIVRAKNAIVEAIFDQTTRFQNGYAAGYVPAPDAFCLLDLIRVLDDVNAELVLDALEYHTIGRKGVSQTSITFKNLPGQTASFSDFVWNNERLNLSLRTYRRGQASFVFNGNDYVIPTGRWRTYTLIADGHPNVARLPVKVDAAGFAVLAKHFDLNSEDDVHFLDLNTIPVINQMHQRPSALHLGRMVLNETMLMGRQTALNALLPKDKSASETLVAVYGQELADWLALEGLTESGFSPRSINAPATDSYIVPTFKISVKGMKSIPTVAVAMKSQSNALKQVMYDTTLTYQNSSPDVIRAELQNVRKELRALRTKIQTVKFVVLMAKKWFREFDKYDAQLELEDGDYTYLFEFGEKEIQI